MDWKGEDTQKVACDPIHDQADLQHTVAMERRSSLLLAVTVLHPADTAAVDGNACTTFLEAHVHSTRLFGRSLNRSSISSGKPYLAYCFARSRYRRLRGRS